MFFNIRIGVNLGLRLIKCLILVIVLLENRSSGGISRPRCSSSHLYMYYIRILYILDCGLVLPPCCVAHEDTKHPNSCPQHEVRKYSHP